MKAVVVERAHDFAVKDVQDLKPKSNWVVIEVL